MKIRNVLASVLAMVMLLTLAACGGGSGGTGSSTGSGTGGGSGSASGSGSTGGGAAQSDTLIIYDGQFSEMRIIHRMVKLLVEEKTDAKVDIRDEMAPPASYDQVKSGNADLMNSYDGTLLTTFLHLDPADVPDDMTLYDFANQEAESEGVELLGKLGLNNTYAIGVPQSVADEYNLETISDLAAVSDQLIFAAEHDFFTEEGSAKYGPMCEFYGLNFKEGRQIDLALKYSAVNNGDVDVTMVYATDGLNKEAGLKILKDDKSFFPEYNGALLVRSDIFERFADAAPNLAEVLDELTGLFTDEIMVDLTYSTDVGEGGVMKTPDEAAKDFLVEKGLIEG